jgi:hypothetical protein
MGKGDVTHDFLVGGAEEGQRPGEQEVEEDAAAPDVALLVVVALNDLGSDIISLPT